MNDITALMATMKAAAENLDGDTWHDEGASVYGGAYDVGDTVCYDHIVDCENVNGESLVAEFIAIANPANVLALVEALEKAQQHEQEWKSLCEAAAVDLDDWQEIDDKSRGLICKMADSIIALNERITSLESRTVTVKLYSAASDVLAERERQVSAEGWTPKHDDQYEHGQLAGAASCYARHVNSRGWIFPSNPESYQQEPESTNWPWTHDWWKPTNPRRDLVKAGALILAEIERIDRAAGIQVIEGEGQ